MISLGLVQASNTPPSSRHSNVLPGLAVKLKLALVRFVSKGGLSVIATSGWTVSTVHV